MSNYLRFQREILPILAPSLRKLIASLPQNLVGALEELRLRALRPLGVVCNRGDGFLQASGRIVSEPERGYMVTREELATTVELISQHSLYAYVEEMRHGYITIPGGHRVGLCGRTVVEERRVVLLRDIQSLNIRISRQVLGAADSVMEHILGPCGRICSTLILSPPGCGKTTLRGTSPASESGIPRLGFPVSRWRWWMNGRDRWLLPGAPKRPRAPYRVRTAAPKPGIMMSPFDGTAGHRHR